MNWSPFLALAFAFASGVLIHVYIALPKKNRRLDEIADRRKYNYHEAAVRHRAY